MKTTTTIIIAAFLGLQTSFLFANNDIRTVTGGSDASSNYCISLMPSTPSEATFEDDYTVTDYTALAPTAPLEASFEDFSTGITTTVTTTSLAPVTPATADFEDTYDFTATDITSIAPVTPAEAQFE